MPIYYLPYQQIDKEKWDACIAQSSNSLIYACSFYLEALSENWDALVLDDYEAVMPRLKRWLSPGGRVYCDFASANRRYGIPSFITKHVWPGKFRMVYMPQFTRALADAGFEIVEMENDRHNYYLWTKAIHDRWVARHDEALGVVDEATWRLMRLLMAGTAYVMSPTIARDTAYRVVLGQGTAVERS